MPRFATLRRVAKEKKKSYDAVRKWAKEGKVPVYYLPGRKAACMDLDEVDEYIASQARADYGSFGPKAVIRDLSRVAQDFEVLD